MCMRCRSFRSPLSAVVALLLSCACSSGEGSTVEFDEGGAEPGISEAEVPGLAPGADGASDCTSSTQSLAVPADEVPVAGSCASRVAAETFTSALCSCEDTSVAGFLRTRSFRSALGPDAPELPGGNVGVNRDYLTGGYADVGGSFAVAGPRDVVFAGFLQVGEHLRFNPAFDVGGFVDVTRDAWLGGSLRAIGSIGIGGDLIRAPNSGFFGVAFMRVGGSERREAFTVAAPCACAPEQLLDVGGLITEARATNDNANIGLDPHALDLVVGAGTALTLPGGRYYLNQIGGIGALRVRISGKVALFIDDDFAAAALFRLALDPGAEVDVFVRDNLVLAGAAVLGDPARPSATRIYVGGEGDIAIAGLNAFAGNVYAPRANVLVGGVGRVFGSLFGKNIVAAGFLEVGYDASIRDGGEDCPPPNGGSPPPGGDTPGGGTPGSDTPEAPPTCEGGSSPPVR
jgi:hypothetical protein